MEQPVQQSPHEDGESDRSVELDSAFAYAVAEWSNSQTEHFYRLITRHAGVNDVLHLFPILQGGEQMVWMRACSAAVIKRRDDIQGYYEPIDFVEQAQDFGSPEYKTAVKNLLITYTQYKRTIPVLIDPIDASGHDYNMVFQYCEDANLDPGRLSVEVKAKCVLIRKMTDPASVAKRALDHSEKLLFDDVSDATMRFYEASAMLNKMQGGPLLVHEGIPYVDYLKQHIFVSKNEAAHMRGLRSGIHGAILEEIKRFWG